MSRNPKRAGKVEIHYETQINKDGREIYYEVTRFIYERYTSERWKPIEFSDLPLYKQRSIIHKQVQEAASRLTKTLSEGFAEWAEKNSS